MSRRRRSILLFSLALLLIFFGLLIFMAGCGSSASSGPAPRQVTVADSATSALKIQTQWPSMMTVGQSNDITIDLLSSSLVASTPGAQHTASVSEATPVGTPNVPVGRAFGPGYESFAEGDLEAPEFAITPSATQTQSLDQPDVQFLWTVSPNTAGPQVIFVTITGQWRPTRGGEVIERTLGEVQLDIQVQPAPAPTPSPPAPQPGLDPGIVAAIIGAVATVVAAIIGALVVIAQMSKDRQKKEKEKARRAHNAARPPEKPPHTHDSPMPPKSWG